MATINCPHCKTVMAGLPDNFHDRLQCGKCAQMFIAEVKDGRARSAVPAMFVLEIPADLEAHLSSDLREACACFGVGAYKATVVMARRFLEAFLEYKGFHGRTLVERVKAAYDAGVVSNLQFQLATSMRMLGNYGAHYSDDRLTQIGQDEAELVLNMVRQILKSTSP